MSGNFSSLNAIIQSLIRVPIIINAAIGEAIGIAHIKTGAVKLSVFLYASNIIYLTTGHTELHSSRQPICYQ